MSVNAQNRRYYCELIDMYDDKEGHIIELNGNILVKKDGLEYSSAMQAVNYMSQQGWQLLQVYCNSLVGSTHYVMYKDAPSLAKAVENIWIGSGEYEDGQYEEVEPLIEIIHWDNESEIEEEQ